MAFTRPTSLQSTGFVLAIAMIFPTILAWFYFQGLSRSDGTSNSLQQGVYVLGKTVQFGFPLLMVGLWSKNWPSVGPWNRQGLATGIGFGLLVFLVILGSYHYLLAGGWLLQPLGQALHQKMREFGMENPYRFLGLAVFLTVIHSLLEEYYWRWFVFGWLRNLIPPWPAIILSSLGFMAHHVLILNAYFPQRFIPAVIPFSLGVAIGGAFWAWMFDRYQSLLGPWISHLIVDAGLMWIGWDLLKATSAPG